VSEEGEGGSSDFSRFFGCRFMLGRLASKAEKKENELQIGLTGTRTNKEQVNKPTHVHQHPCFPDVGQSRHNLDLIATSRNRDSPVQW
jgi:hypothetical protein